MSKAKAKAKSKGKVGRPKGPPSERKKHYVPTTFYFDERLKKSVAMYCLDQKFEGNPISQEQFINAAVKEKCDRLGLK